VASVEVKLGATALTRTPREPYSSAKARVKFVTAPYGTLRFQEMRQCFAGRKVHTVEVSPYDLPPVLCGGLREGAKDCHPRVVDQHIQLPKLIDRVFDKALYIRLVRHISGMNK
jgi:hypothetical protein